MPRAAICLCLVRARVHILMPKQITIWCFNSTESGLIDLRVLLWADLTPLLYRNTSQHNYTLVPEPVCFFISTTDSPNWPTQTPLTQISKKTSNVMNTSILPIEDNLKGKQLLCIPLDDREKRETQNDTITVSHDPIQDPAVSWTFWEKKKTSTITQDGHGRGSGKTPSRTIPNELATLK